MRPLVLRAKRMRLFFTGSARRRATSGSGFLLLWLLAAGVAAAQTTTISGTILDPRTTSYSLPLPNVLVYVTTGAVASLPAGVQCLKPSAPTGVTSYTNTAVDGSFTLTNVPVNASYTIVIQSGKWRRQFPQAVGTTPVTGLSLHMPADHTQGDIPMIAISTGSVDGVECVLRDMGIADTEFTDDNGTTNPGGHIHLYSGGGASISPTTPPEMALTDTPATLNSYDLVMFPCNGYPVPKSTTGLTDIVNFANAGGRIFTTHYSYDWLDPDAPFNSLFPPVANWNPIQQAANDGVGTVNTSFTEGATMAQWLQNAGATLPNQPDEINVTTLRRDLDDVIPPTQPWLTIPATSGPDWILQLTFNAPVNAAAAQQCGRVLFNEYHVVNLNTFTGIFPAECAAPGPMSPQEEMLEYALFDLSAFEQAVVIPTLSIGFVPSPLAVKPGDTGEQVTLNLTNTSTTSVVDSSTVLTVALPPLLSATAISDASGGWKCTLSTLTCTRTTPIAPLASNSVVLTLDIAQYPPGGPPSGGGVITATASSPTFSKDLTATDNVVYRQPPAIAWATPAPIVYGTALSAVQLDATSTVAGSFTYTPPASTILAVGQHILSATLSPTDTANYIPGTASVTLTVVPAIPQVNVTASPSPAFISNPVTFTATVPSPASAPTGTVAFYDGSTQIGSSGVAAGSGTLSTSSLALGTHIISAVYSGDSNYQRATSATLPVLMEDFSMKAAGNAGGVTVLPGVSASYTFVIAPIGGPTLPAVLNLSIDGLPPGTTASFSPSTVAANSGATTVTLTVTPKSLSGIRLPGGPLGKGTLPVALGMILLPIAGTWRKARRSGWMVLLIALSGAALTLGMNACGGVTYTPHSFSMTATANSGALSHSANVEITVK